MPPDYAFHLGLYGIPPLQPGEDENVLLPLPPLVTRLRLEAERRNTGNPSGLQYARRVTWYRLEGKLKVQDYYAVWQERWPGPKPIILPPQMD